jgi:uncharacterized protein with HEPN domain
MRPEKLYLLDIVEAAEAISRFCENLSEDDFHQDELRQSAVLQKLIVIGKAASRLPIENDLRQCWQKRTPAMVAGLTDHIWTVKELLTLIPLPLQKHT